MDGSIGTVLAIVDSLFGLLVARRDQHNAVLLQWSERMVWNYHSGLGTLLRMLVSGL
jgi:ArsR family metal-binding transcriptional regulator